MWKITKPVVTSQDAFRACISKVRNAELKARLESIENDVIQASNAFEAAVAATVLHQLVAAASVAGRVTKEEMSDVYTNRMAHKDGPGRAIYDQLLSAPLYGRCPLCGQRVVSTLDHHLPKKLYPALAVAPPNLVPACADCNKAKLETTPHSSEEETIHPYFDDIEDHTWLRAQVIETSPAALRFFVDPPDQWSAIMATRVGHHFKLLKLSYLYASHAADELVNIRYFVAALHARAGAAAVRQDLLDRAISCEQGRTNSWQTATYRALVASDWYCEVGFA